MALFGFRRMSLGDALTFNGIWLAGISAVLTLATYLAPIDTASIAPQDRNVPELMAAALLLLWRGIGPPAVVFGLVLFAIGLAVKRLSSRRSGKG